MKKVIGRRKVFFSGDCNNLAETVTAELKLAGMNAFDITPLSYEEAIKLLQEAQKHGTKALITTAL